MPAPRLRSARDADIAFLARIEVLASTPPFPESVWVESLVGTSTAPEAFVAAMLAERACLWGQVEERMVMELHGQPVASCALITPEGPDRRALDLTRLPALAARLGWSAATADAFRARYEASWGPVDDPWLTPQAPALIESLAVLPEAQGRGLGRRLVEAACAAARARGFRAIGVMAIHGNNAAHALYRAAGFRPWANFPASYFGGGFPGVTRYRQALPA